MTARKATLLILGGTGEALRLPSSAPESSDCGRRVKRFQADYIGQTLALLYNDALHLHSTTEAKADPGECGQYNKRGDRERWVNGKHDAEGSRDQRQAGHSLDVGASHQRPELTNVITDSRRQVAGAGLLEEGEGKRVDCLEEPNLQIEEHPAGKDKHQVTLQISQSTPQQ